MTISDTEELSNMPEKYVVEERKRHLEVEKMIKNMILLDHRKLNQLSNL